MPYGYGTQSGLPMTMPSYGGGYLNPYVLIILILIVLQWFRVGTTTGGPGYGAVSPERGLLNNGGLFIIAIFLLIYCSCANRLY